MRINRTGAKHTWVPLKVKPICLRIRERARSPADFDVTPTHSCVMADSLHEKSRHARTK